MDYTYRFVDGEGTRVYEEGKLKITTEQIPKNIRVENLPDDVSDELRKLDKEWYRRKQESRESEDYNGYSDIDEVAYEEFQKNDDETEEAHYTFDGERISDELGRFLASLSEPQLKTVIAKYRYGSNHKVAKELCRNRKTIINSLNLVKEKAKDFEEGILYDKIQGSNSTRNNSNRSIGSK